eukprot:2946599-Rhodomonas_salina.1
MALTNARERHQARQKQRRETDMLQIQQREREIQAVGGSFGIEMEQSDESGTSKPRGEVIQAFQ